MKRSVAPSDLERRPRDQQQPLERRIGHEDDGALIDDARVEEFAFPWEAVALEEPFADDQPVVEVQMKQPARLHVESEVVIDDYVATRSVSREQPAAELG